MGNLNEIQKQTTQSYGDNSFTTTIKENTVEFDSAKDSFTFNDEVNVPSLKVNGQEITPTEPQVQADWNQNDSEAVDYIKNKPSIKAGQGENSIIEGDGTTANENNSHAEGSYTTASGYTSHAEGASTTASGYTSHAEGGNTTASGTSSHAEGDCTNAIGDSSHAEGSHTTASGSMSHAEGCETIANHKSQHVYGEFNIADPSTNLATARGNYVEIVGKGTDNTHRSNARTLDWSGNETLAGNLTIGGTITSNGQQILPQKQADWNQTTSTGSDYIKNKPAIKAGQGVNSIVEGDLVSNFSTGKYSHAEGGSTTAEGQNSHAEGNATTASGQSSHAEGGSTTASGQNSHAEGNLTTASGTISHAEGSGTTASGYGSHVEGSYTTASGSKSHAEGQETTASGDYSHAEGKFTTASGYYSHAEGYKTTASGSSSHAEGYQTTANHKSQHVFGEFNIVDLSLNTPDARGNYVEIVGKGADENTRSNARTLDWDGNETLAGNLTIGGASGATLKVESGVLKVSFDGGTTWLTVSAS